MHLHETLAALVELGLACQSEVLRQAAEIWLASERMFPETGEELVSEALEGEFDEHDAAFHECAPSVTEALKSHLEEHQDEYVRVE